MAMPLRDRIATGIFWLFTVPLVLFFLYGIVRIFLESGFSFWLLAAALCCILYLVFGLRQCYRILRTGETSAT